MTVESFGGLSRYPRRGLGYSGMDTRDQVEVGGRTMSTDCQNCMARIRLYHCSLPRHCQNWLLHVLPSQEP